MKFFGASGPEARGGAEGAQEEHAPRNPPASNRQETVADGSERRRPAHRADATGDTGLGGDGEKPVRSGSVI